MKKKGLMLVALLLVMSLMLEGCMFWDVDVDGFQSMLEKLPTAEQTEATEETTPAGEKTYPPHTPYEEFDRAEGYLQPMKFADMSYVRPDADKICEGFRQVQEAVEGGADLLTVLTAFDETYEEYEIFSTLSQIAYIRYTIDLNNTFYDEENTWCENQAPLVEQAQEKCYIAMANSPLRAALEEEYFGEGFFDFYDENQVYSKDSVVKLMQEESDLQNQYMALQSDMTIEWKGEDCLVEDLLADEDLPYDELLQVYAAYYEKYNPLAAELYIQLVGVRQEIARELEYDSYADFAYSYYYERDYTPAQAAEYTASVARELSPLYYSAAYASYEQEMDMDEVMEKLKDATYTLGGNLATAYDFMEAYEMYDLSSSSSKMPGSYMTYLTSYEMPFLYVSPTGDIGDLLTAAHEFGHFTDGFVNCDGTTAIDCNEIFSQGLEYLTLGAADLTSRERRKLTASKMADSVLTFLSQACYAEFEQRVFEIPAQELTAEKLNEIFLECNEEFGMGMYGFEDILAPGWIDIQHFFIAPFYVISYCVSNDAALQIYQLQEETGYGLETYETLMSLSSGNTVLNLLEQAGMESPFKEGRMAELAEFFAEKLE